MKDIDLLIEKCKGGDKTLDFYIMEKELRRDLKSSEAFLLSYKEKGNNFMIMLCESEIAYIKKLLRYYD